MPANKDGFTLQPRDVQLIYFVHELGIATVELMARHVGASYHIAYKRIQKLESRRFLSRITKQPEKGIWQLGSEGTAVLMEQGYVPESIARRRLRAHELKELGRKHTLMLSHIHAKLLADTKDRPQKLAAWRQDSGIWAKAIWREDNGRETRLPVRPDAYFIIQHMERPEGKNRMHFFIEADRSTEDVSERMAQKIKAYRAFHDGDGFQSKFPGMKTFRMFVVTESRRRADSLRHGLEYLLPTADLQRAYRFIPIEDFGLTALLPSASAVHTVH